MWKKYGLSNECEITFKKNTNDAKTETTNMKLVFNAIIAYFLIIHGRFSNALEIGIADATNSGE